MVRKPEVRYLCLVLQGLLTTCCPLTLSLVASLHVFGCAVIWKMSWLTLSLAALILGLEREVYSAPASTEESIKINLIGYESDLTEQLTPPAPDAYNYYNVESPRSELEFPYTVEISSSNLNIKTGGLPDQKIKLTQAEREGIQKLSLSIIELLNSSKLASGAPEDDIGAPEWSQLNPVIVLTNSGVSLKFLNASESELFSVAETPAEHKQILWDFLAKYTKNIFEEKLRELNLNNKFAEVVDSPAGQSNSPFENFTDLLWRIMKFSVNYAERAFEGWTTARPVVAPESGKTPAAVDTLLAYEELPPFHEFPSQEFHFRRKDVDSIFYGRGVI